MPCVWVQAWDGASRMKDGNEAIKNIEFAVDYRDKGSSTWLKLAREPQESQEP
jgi:hypothetical protein